MRFYCSCVRNKKKGILFSIRLYLTLSFPNSSYIPVSITFLPYKSITSIHKHLHIIVCISISVSVDRNYA